MIIETIQKGVIFMKKWLALFLSFCLILSFVACDTDEATETTETSTTVAPEILPGGTYRFTAEIQKIMDTYLEVYTEDETMRRTSDLFHVSIPNGVDIRDFAVGDTVEIVYAGAIEEIYPARIKGTVSIEIWQCGLTAESSFDAKVMDIDKQNRNITVKTIETDEKFQVHMEDLNELDIAIGDILQITYDAFTENEGLKTIPKPLAIRFRQRFTSDIHFEALVLEIAEDFVRVLGTTEGYEREFIAMVDNGDELLIGEKVKVNCVFRGEYAEHHPVIMERASVISMTPKTYDFNARIIETYDRVFLVAGGYVGLCRLSFSSEVSLEGYQAGDYIHVTFNGNVAESRPTQARGYGIRYMTDEEIAGFHQEKTLRGTYKGISDGMVCFHAGNKDYYFAANAVDFLPMMTQGDIIEVVYDRLITHGMNGIHIRFPESVRVVEE